MKIHPVRVALTQDAYMNLRLKFRLLRTIRSPLFGALVVTMLTGLVSISLPAIAKFSYDMSFLFKKSSSPEGIALVFANEATLRELGNNGRIDRRYHARLLDKLREQGASLVFYDFAFLDSDEADSDLSEAMRKNGKVVLVGSGETFVQGGVRRRSLHGPDKTLREAAAAWGHAELIGDVVRQISGDFESVPYAVWLAAQSANQDLIEDSRNDERWLNLLDSDPARGFDNYLFQDVLKMEVGDADTFRGKVVFVGQRYSLSELGGERDTFPTAYSRLDGVKTPGVIIHATAFANLTDGTWLKRAPWAWQVLVSVTFGFIVVVPIYWVSRKKALISSVIACVLGGSFIVVTMMVQESTHVWIAWIGLAFGQPAAALLWTRFHPKSSHYDVFISYRTHDDSAAALLLAQRLWEQGRNAFIDVDRLEAGRFDEQLVRCIEEAPYFVPILSPGSLDRCRDPDDWVLREIRHALDSNRKVIPVFRGGFTFAEIEGLDIPELKKLASFHGLEFSTRDVDGFTRRLEKLMREPLTHS